jgi:hypothetical protein
MLLLLVALALLFGGVGQVSAGPITWGSATTISGDTDVVTTGTLVGALNVGFDGSLPPSNTTINGVTFVGLDVITNSTTTSGPFTFGSVGTLAANGTPPSGLSTSYQTLLKSLTLAGPFTLTMNGLTIGDQYEFEWWSNKSDTRSILLPPSLTTAMAGNSVVLSSNTTNTTGGVGQFAIGKFTFDGTSEVITFSGTNGTVLNGLQLRDLGPAATGVPEPSTLTLLSLGSLGLLGYGCRRRNRAAA